MCIKYLKEEGIRKKESFHMDWEFALEEETKCWKHVVLPHDWSTEYGFDENAQTCGSGGFVRAGAGNYKKSFCIGAGAVGKRIFLHFDGVYMLSKVWLNGQLLGEHVYGYTPFSFDITDQVKLEGENLLEVFADNSHQPGSRWYSGSGITRNVWIEAVSDLHMDAGKVYCFLKERTETAAVLKVEVPVAGKFYESDSKIRQSCVCMAELLDAEGDTVAEGSACIGSGEQPVSSLLLTVSNPKLWSPEEPNLYQLRLSLTKNGECMDQIELSTGIREIAFDADKGFLLNGKSVKMNGVCVHQDGGCVGSAVPADLWKMRLEKLKKMGCNAVRMSHNPPDPALLDLCDSMGFLVMDEAFDEWKILKGKEFGSNTHESKGYSQWFDTCHIEDLEAMLYRDRNHPSIVIWSIGNEVPDQTKAEGVQTALELKEICRRLAPDRPVTQANDQICAEPAAATEEFLEALDLVGYNYVGRWRTREETLYADDRMAHPKWKLIGTENPGMGGIRGEYSLEAGNNWWKRPYYSAPVTVGKLLKYTMTHDFVIGDFMWTGIDYLGEAMWPYRSATSGVLDTCGFEKDGYYFYKSIWNREEPMVHGLPDWNLNVKEGTIVPVLAYTNCDYAELIANGVSYGKKAYSYPAYGMTEVYGHFDTPPRCVNTDDLFLSWDVPYVPGTVELIGYKGEEVVCREVLQTAGTPSKILVNFYHPNGAGDSGCLELPADGQSCGLAEVTVLDENGNFCPSADVKIHCSVEGAACLKAVDNGRPDSHELFTSPDQETFHGKALIVIQSNGETGKAVLSVTVEEMESETAEVWFR